MEEGDYQRLNSGPMDDLPDGPRVGGRRSLTFAPSNMEPAIGMNRTFSGPSLPARQKLRRAATESAVMTPQGMSRRPSFFTNRSSYSFPNLSSSQSQVRREDKRYGEAPLSPMQPRVRQYEDSEVSKKLQKILKTYTFDPERIPGCTLERYYHQHELTGTALMYAVERACVDEDNYLDDLDYVLEALHEDPDEEAFKATYEFYGHHTIHAMHLAASLGNINVMERIRKTCGDHVIVDKSILVKQTERHPIPKESSRATMWGATSAECSSRMLLRNVSGPVSQSSTLSTPMVPSRPSLNDVSTEHYPPLHSAIYMSKVEAAIWLLENGADANASNTDDITALHHLAVAGLPHEIDARVRDEGLQAVVTKLIEYSADLRAQSGDFKVISSRDVDFKRQKTPLEIAAHKRSGYPKHMLHLLARSFQNLDESEPLSEVAYIAKTNPSAAEHLMSKVKGNRAAKKRLLLEVNASYSEDPPLNGVSIDQRQPPEPPKPPIETFLEVLQMSPVAAADVLEVLTFKPKVKDIQKNPLPVHAVLENRSMLVTYQSDVEEQDRKTYRTNPWARPVWEYPQQRWHHRLMTELPMDPLEQDKVYAVEVCVVHLPDLMDMRVAHILGRLWTTPTYTEVFSRIPIQALIECFWTCAGCHRAHRLTMVMEFLLLLLLAVLGVCPPPTEWTFLQRAIPSVLVAKLLLEFLLTLHGMEAMAHWETGIVRRGEDQSEERRRMNYLWHYASWPVILSMPLFLQLAVWGDSSENNIWKLLVAVNIFARCCKFLFLLLRSERGFGVTVIAVVNSGTASQMQNMLVIVGFVVLTFWLVFVTIKDSDKSCVYVFLYLYLALFFGEGDGIENISGFDTDGQTYNGSQSEALRIGSIIFMLIGSFISMVFLLNLIIAMYSNTYQEQQPVAQLLFHQKRCKDSIQYLLRPSLPGFLVRRFGWRCCQRFCFAVSFALFMAWLGLTHLHDAPYHLSLLLAAAVQSCEAGLLLTQWAPGSADAGKPHYLWIAYRADFDEDQYWQSPEQKKLTLLQRSFTDLSQQVGCLMEMFSQSAAIPNSPAVAMDWPRPSRRSVSRY